MSTKGKAAARPAGPGAPPPLAADIARLAASYREAPSPEAEARLRVLRRTLATLWLRLDPAAVPEALAGEVGAAHRALLASDLRYGALTGEEAAVADALEAAVAGGWPAPAAAGPLLAAMLYRWPAALNPRPAIASLPAWLAPTVMTYLVSGPAFFAEPGQAARELAHMADLTEELHALALAPGAGEAALAAANAFVENASFVRCYFNEADLRALFSRRGDLIADYLVRRGHALDWRAPPRTACARIRIGVLAQHFGPQTDTYHALACLEHLDRSRFEVRLYSIRPFADALADHAASRAEAAIQLPADDLAAQVARLRSDGIDVLLVANNVTAVPNAVCLLAAHRVARIQVALATSPCTTGLAAVDAFLSSSITEPECGAATQYRERLLTPPITLNRFAYAEDREPATLSFTRGDLGIPDDAVVFASGANVWKLLPELVTTWARVMAQVPESRLLLYPFNRNWSRDYPNLPVLDALAATVAAAGIDPARVRVVPPMPARADVHRLLALADVYLDSHPFAGSCSLFDPLLVAVPPVARAGATFRSRISNTILKAVGLDELIAADEDAYVRLAVDLANDPERRRALAARIGGAMATAPFFETRSFGAEVGAVLENLWRAHEAEDTALAARPAPQWARSAQARAERLAASGNAQFARLDDRALLRRLILPFFQGLPDPGRPRTLVDVGACVGETALPFLRAGWRAELFEPDPAARRILAPRLAAFAERARLHAVACGAARATAVDFHRNRVIGLSGLAPSALGKAAETIQVPMVALGDALAPLGAVDLLKVDAEGADRAVLAGHDFERLRPRLVMAEFADAAAADDLTALMAAQGYTALLVEGDDDGNFARGEWAYRVRAAHVATAAAPARAGAFGNLVFHAADDRAFLRALDELLAAMER